MFEKEALKKELRKAMLRRSVEKRANIGAVLRTGLGAAGQVARGVGGVIARNPGATLATLGGLGTAYGGYKAWQGLQNFFNRKGNAAGGNMNMRNQLLNQNQLAPGMQKQNSEKQAAGLSVLKSLLGKVQSFGAAARRMGGKPVGGASRRGPQTRLGQMVPSLGGGKINEGIHDAIVDTADFVAPAVGGAGRVIADHPGASLAGAGGVGLGGLALALGGDKQASVGAAGKAVAKTLAKAPKPKPTSLSSVVPGGQFMHLKNTRPADRFSTYQEYLDAVNKGLVSPQ